MSPTTCHLPCRKNRLLVRVLVLVGLVLMGLRPGQAAAVTGMVVFGADSSGTYTRDIWNTLGGDFLPFNWFNLYVVQGSMGDPFLNSGDGPETSVNIPLALGIHSFTLWGSPPADPNPAFGLNIFFDGDNSIPGISAFAPVNVGPSPPFPPFFPDSSPSTVTLDVHPAPGSGSLSFVDGSVRITVTDYSWSEPAVFGTDRVSPYNNMPDGANDWVGRLTLEVDPIPEPATFGLIGAGLLGLSMISRKKGPAKIATAARS